MNREQNEIGGNEMKIKDWFIGNLLISLWQFWVMEDTFFSMTLFKVEIDKGHFGFMFLNFGISFDWE